MTPTLLLLAAVSLAQVPGNVQDCQPCTFRPGANLPPYHFSFDVKTGEYGRTVEAVRVSTGRDTAPLERLPVKSMAPIPSGEPFFFGGVDLNLDGFLDLMLITDRGVANAYAEYWLFDPSVGKYAYLGKYPVFRLDPRSHRLLTYERGGMAGLIFESREYEFSGRKLLVVKSEKQDATAKPGVFRKVIRERVKGQMKTARTETVKAPQ